MFFAKKCPKKVQIFGYDKFSKNIIRWEEAVEDIFTRQSAQSFVWTQVGILIFFCGKWCFGNGSGCGGNDAIQNHELSSPLQRQNMQVCIFHELQETQQRVAYQLADALRELLSRDWGWPTMLRPLDIWSMWIWWIFEYSSQIIEWELPRRGWEGLNMHHPCVININCRIYCTSIGGKGRKLTREENMLDS